MHIEAYRTPVLNQRPKNLSTGFHLLSLGPPHSSQAVFAAARNRCCAEIEGLKEGGEGLKDGRKGSEEARKKGEVKEEWTVWENVQRSRLLGYECVVCGASP